MIFNSQIFLGVFLPVVLCAYYMVADRPSVRQGLLILASLVFYGAWDARFVWILPLSVIANWSFSRAYGGSGSRLCFLTGIVFNLGLLGVFKYADFAGDSVSVLLGTDHQPWSFVLPLGISFFTFQQISYLADLRRGEAPEYGFLEYAAYVTFFPQLVAGPIVRHHQLVPQLQASAPTGERRWRMIGTGLNIFVLGLFKKLIADRLADFVDPLFTTVARGDSLSFIEAWFAAGGFGLQIYFDFAGYSQMAIGLGLMFGFYLPPNFNDPYSAGSIIEFWRRWHMTLSSFLRDYLYIPLGGNRRGRVRAAANVLATMLLGGLWHGAGWTFVVWGGMHGAAIVVNRLWRATKIPLPPFLCWTLTLLFVMAAWVPFRADTFTDAFAIWRSMAGWETSGAGLFGWTHRPLLDLGKPLIAAFDLLAAALALFLLMPQRQRLAGQLHVPTLRRGLAIGLVLAVCFLITGQKSDDFIYFVF